MSSAQPTASSAQLTASDARRVDLEIGGRPVAALRCGASDGARVLMVPGYTGSKEDFAPLFGPLAAAGFGVHAIDLPGQFESWGPDDQAAYTPDALGRVVREVARDIGGPVHLVGHSYGGLVARAAAIQEPAAFADIVLMSSGPSALQGPRRARIEQLGPLLPTGGLGGPGGLGGLYAAMQSVIRAEPGYVAPSSDLADFLRRRFLAGSPTMLAGMAGALCAEPDRVTELAATRLPVLVIYGAHDDAWPPAILAGMADRLGSMHVVVPAAAHSPAVETPAETAEALVNFWTRQGGAAGLAHTAAQLTSRSASAAQG